MFSASVNISLYVAFHFMALSALYLGLWSMLVRTGRRPVHAALFGTAYVLCTFGAAKILFDLFKSYEPFEWLDVVDPLHYLEPGFWGWMLAFLPVSALYPFVFRLDRTEFFRALALAMPIVIFFQKAACLVSGCCIGVPSDLPWALAYPETWGSSAYLPPAHPVPLYDAASMLLVAWGLRTLDRREAARPYLYPTFIMLYSVSRFLTEMFRPAFEVATSQRFEVATVVLMLLVLTLGRNHWLWILGRASGTGEVRTLQPG